MMDFATAYITIQEVVDCTGDYVARHVIGYNTLDDAMRAYGHAVAAHNQLERDRRLFRQLKQRRDHAESAAKNSAPADPDRPL